ncbi:uncharacterized protein [Epargyreus clarus]|uniref:uncharacterized protein n=1 Tax=Epargyreus clarus TaxID=520877 RepID=UPI003C2E3269
MKKQTHGAATSRDGSRVGARRDAIDRPLASSRRGKLYTRGSRRDMTARKLILTTEQTFALIENVRNHACIWKLDHEFYNDRNAVAVAWTGIANEIKLPEELIRVKWKNLRDLFMREIKRLDLTNVDEYHGKWKYFKTLSFLYRSENNTTASEEDSSELPEVPLSEPYVVKLEPTDSDYTYDPEQEPELMPEKRKRIENNSTSEPYDVGENLLEQTPLDKRRRINEVYMEEDYDVMFLKSLTPYFKSLKPTRKLVIRNKIQEMLLKEISQPAMNGQL